MQQDIHRVDVWVDDQGLVFEAQIALSMTDTLNSVAGSKESRSIFTTLPKDLFVNRLMTAYSGLFCIINATGDLLCHTSPGVPDRKQYHRQHHGRELKHAKENLIRIEISTKSLRSLRKAEAGTQVNQQCRRRKYSHERRELVLSDCCSSSEEEYGRGDDEASD